MNYAKNVTEYFGQNENWRQELMMIRDIILSTELEERIKWGVPVYTLNAKNLVALSAFKSYFGLWFYQGALLKDNNKVLLNAQEGVTKALRQWRFDSIDDINTELIIEYVNEAIINQKEGKEIKPEKKKTPELSYEMNKFFKLEPKTAELFKGLTPFKQREYIEFISSAKREETRITRLNKIVPLINSGLGLNDKYR